MSRIMVVDGMSVLKTTAGGAAFLTNGFAYNFFTQLTAMLKRFKDIKGVIVCWEGGYDHRTKIFSSYKSNRKPSGSEIRDQRKLVQELLTYIGVDQVYSPGHEADDVAAYLTHNLGVPILLESNDTDWLQLVKPGVSIWQKSAMSEGKKNSRVEITHENFEHYTGYPNPALYLECKALIGDPVDGVTGIHGVGPATAKSYVLGNSITPVMKQKIEDFRDSGEFARNKMLIDLISPRDLTLVWTKGELNEEKALHFLKTVGGVGWPSVVKVFPTWWWEVYKNVSS